MPSLLGRHSAWNSYRPNAVKVVLSHSATIDCILHPAAIMKSNRAKERDQQGAERIGASEREDHE